MRPSFCDYHILAFWDGYAQSAKPLDLALRDYLRSHKSIGARDRREIGETLYGMVRWKTLVDAYCPHPNHPLERLNCYKKISSPGWTADLSLPESTRLGMSEFLYQKFVQIFGKEKARELCRILNTQAPVTIRINPLKTNREAMLKMWEGRFALSPCKQAPHGIQFQKREPLFTLPEFKAGLFEVQDEGSQLVAGLVQVKPGEHVLDYCSGSGGKTLSFAPSMEGKGQIYLHDNRAHILQEARKRMRRAGIQNVQFVLPRKKVDWVLADVPCSGTGTLRRNPDAKWKIDSAMIERLVQQQQEIIAEALLHLKPGGHFVYATCSLLPEENQNQVEKILQTYPLVLQGEPLFLLPEEGGMDGFFAALFKHSPR